MPTPLRWHTEAQKALDWQRERQELIRAGHHPGPSRENHYVQHCWCKRPTREHLKAEEQADV